MKAPFPWDDIDRIRHRHRDADTLEESSYLIGAAREFVDRALTRIPEDHSSSKGLREIRESLSSLRAELRDQSTLTRTQAYQCEEQLAAKASARVSSQLTH